MTDSSDSGARRGRARAEVRLVDMWASPENDPREAGGPVSGERATLVRYLRGRLTLPAVVADAWATWRSEVAFAERLAAEAPDLDVQGTGGGERDPVALREVLVHMIEEPARHNGHADLIRERIDGRVGQ